ncbi:TIGR01777 family oxidoreductase [Staphylococcus pseudoxylosus]|uniref:TIGR01777 family oxidoreductase n=1 Tax=Staphylococcus pseudoxylosus TaxID=2282419 RepID=UPI000D1DD8F6|nr:TIGR01777 family oxidoreductase [Staphylococcus pseudoxylosus]PTI57402.1 TIGR01777 family protein [Staphylococcus xylosus]MDW8799378.1 TIGR01777 family oxidoreductase [Staphylococcus pseudoxylosus]MEB6037121.1 TIGR01777 family oxidoreductase [Staphylococcus pseudoxylosus]MEB6045807.1 TIGR01777 family oxidoreductase [Staphylococcus pseudoxylosus]MEB6061562.1 TIGR01777 family oxidoreductase [Staphylococcus pseudoxylosus]
MKNYLITGGTGMVGTKLVEAIVQSDSHITILTRQDKTTSHPKITYVNWSNPDWEAQVPDIDIVINLAGASLNKRWTKSYKQKIMVSRLQSTQALFELFEGREQKPSVFFNASAVGYYKPDLYRTYTELYKTLPFDFLSEVVYQWERLARQFESLGTRVVIGRFGMVLSNEGGALPMMKLPYEFYVGGKIGSGRQWYSWIHIDDLTRAILHTINTEEAQGVFNFTAPIVEHQNLFGYTLARASHRPHYTWVPSLALRIILGQMSTVILDTQKVIPNKLQAIDFKFKYPDLKIALEDLVH